MDDYTKKMSLARNAMLHAEHRRKRLHDGSAVVGKTERLSMKAAYDAARRGMALQDISKALNSHGGLPVKDEPGMHVEAPNSPMCMSFDEIMPAVQRRITVGDQQQATPTHPGFRNGLVMGARMGRDIDDEGY